MSVTTVTKRMTVVARRAKATGLVTGLEWTPAEVRELLRLAGKMKANPARYRNVLAGKFVALIFEKPSLRTRMSLEVGAESLGARAIFLDNTASRLGEREPVRDVAKNLGRWVQAIAARTFAQETVEELASHSGVPVVNALSDRYHPCQALADFLTLEERFGALEGLRLAWVGDGNNVCHSLMIAAAQMGSAFRAACPAGYAPDAEVVAEARQVASSTGASIELFEEPEAAVKDAQAVYTDVWASMGQESEADQRAKIFAPFQVNKRLMSAASSDAAFLHCLPAHRGLEVTEDVIDSPQSLVYEQAENRLHIAKAVLAMLAG